MQHIRILREEVSIYALASKVWKILTQPQYTCQYFFDSTVISKWERGGPIFLEVERDGEKKIIRTGSIIEIVPGIALHFALLEESQPFANAVSTRYDLLPEGTGIRLKLMQEIFALNDEQYKIAAEHWLMILQKIKWLAEYG
jgi:uncharacterized protein YndB with AHSA1/START domain